MDLIKQIFDSGVVGCGGAGFPTHVKLKASPEILIINGAECEPLLRTDRYLMIHEAEKLVSGVDLICRELSIPEGRIALKKTYTKEIEALKKYLTLDESGKATVDLIIDQENDRCETEGTSNKTLRLSIEVMKRTELPPMEEFMMLFMEAFKQYNNKK